MSVAIVIPPRERDLGDGMKVRRALPYVHKRMVGPFIFWDHMGPVTINEHFEMLVRSHPHIGLATLTYLLSGEMLHRDSLGNELVIRPREVNWMTAGSGIVHSERASVALGQGGQTLEGIQLWIALPKREEERPASFVHIDRAQLPVLEVGKATWTLIAGEYRGQKSPVPVYSPLFYLESIVPSGYQTEFALSPTHEGALYIAKGEVDVAGQRYGEGHLVVFQLGAKVSFTAVSESDVLVFGGEPFPEPRHITWNFVSSSKERIEQAKDDWTNQRMGKVPKETDWIPLPPV